MVESHDFVGFFVVLLEGALLDVDDGVDGADRDLGDIFCEAAMKRIYSRISRKNNKKKNSTIVG